MKRLLKTFAYAMAIANLHGERATAQNAADQGAALKEQSLDQLLAQLRGLAGSPEQSQKIVGEILARGVPAYNELLAHFKNHDQYYQASAMALVHMPAFG